MHRSPALSAMQLPRSWRRTTPLQKTCSGVALHPLDQFRAFADMAAKGQREEAIAAAFFVSPTLVKQRLRLASRALP